MNRLSKVARELNANISDVALFLRSYGFKCEEDPNEELTLEQTDIIKYNYAAFEIERKKETKLRSSQKKSTDNIATESVPLELRIIDSASKEKKLIERIVGFTEFNWSFETMKYKGECLQPVEFNLFDQVICDLLLTEQMTAQSIGRILGFDIERDNAEREILSRALTELSEDRMIEGNGAVIWLTDVGKEYAKNGVKFSTYKRTFELYFDRVAGVVNGAKNIFSKLKSEKITTSKNTPDVSFDEIKKLAEHQAPEIHFPDKNYLLQSAEFISAERFTAKVWVVLLENFRDNSLRSLVYDEKDNTIVNILSEALDKKEEIKNSLLEKLVKIDDGIEFTEEDKQKDQLDVELQLIAKQVEIDKAVDKKDTGKVIEIQKEIESIRRHFNSLEFEVELKRLFDDTADDLWIISPWIRVATLQRIPFFEKYLKKGGRIFVAYSKPEKPGDIMAYEEPLNKLLDLERKYQNFYLHQLDTFHYKNVWLRKQDSNHLYYTGSYNILSFFVMQGFKKVRQEKMTRLDWNKEVQAEFAEVVKDFGLKYVNKAIEDFNSLCQNAPQKITREYLQKLRTIDNAKLKPFVDHGIKEFDEAFRQLEETKSVNLNVYRKIFFEDKIESFQKRTEELARHPITLEQKRGMQGDFERLRDEFIDFMDLQIGKAQHVAESIENLKLVRSQISKSVNK
ncbi:MAG TPA: hypothetical protein VFU05_02775 [Cyclobacteriaceae bacterium]|nr:hypothetical protein [Cyclobacteriaceae bacterium]